MLYEALPVRVEGRELVDCVVRVSVGGAVAEGKERVERGEGSDAQLALHILRLIEDEDGSCGLNEVDRRSALKPIRGSKDDIAFALLAERLVETVDRHHVELETAGGRELPNLAEVLGVVDVVPERKVVINLVEVCLCDLDCLEHALADRHRWNDDDELAESVASAEFHGGADIDVGLSGSSLHFDAEIGEPHRGFPGGRRNGVLDELEFIILRKLICFLGRP